MKRNEGYLKMFKHTNARRSKLFAGISSIAVLTLLTGCAAEDTSGEPPADQEADQSVEATESPEASADNDASPTDGADEQTNDSDQTGTAGDDPVYDIIDAVESEYADGFIISIDRDDDNDTHYEVDVVVNSEVEELDVTADGTVSVNEAEQDDDDVAEAEAATVTVVEALDQAFEQHSDASFDQIELDEDDGTLHWDIDLDGSGGEEIELEIAAN